MVPILSFFWNEITLPTKTLRHLASRLLADEISRQETLGSQRWPESVKLKIST